MASSRIKCVLRTQMSQLDERRHSGTVITSNVMALVSSDHLSIDHRCSIAAITTVWEVSNRLTSFRPDGDTDSTRATEGSVLITESVSRVSTRLRR